MKSSQTDFFIDKGYLRLEGFHPKKQVAGIRQKLLDELKRLKALPGGKSLSGSLQRLPLFQQIGKLSALVKVPGLHAALATPDLIECVTRLGGRAPSAIQDTQLLLSPPNQGAATLEGLNWHVDIAAGPQDPLPGVQAFFLIDDVTPSGGATLALAGSHRVDTLGRPSASRLREVLKTPGDLERSLQPLGIDIVEMSGRAGDVFLIDLRLLHAPSVNATKNVRMMATVRCFLNT
ncbi:phytanoyl-CoA dioxygenase family protein [Variovorax sp. ZS18.2.2]|uniref:phytanoyl-CoA dioxygenase family protein n=1 Tax=Variovorax sp. ZS18.2.2 TaxID=2971255 RepID=UPI002151263A|nr:phytanoyl-CoA dioxygenase family protein [Variovorax sp. ZS18.2.2]MCR6480492.1 phytanoyl-CoA dioxygenase family protein [Variovorax sp. ZS18.2.2]